MKVAIQGPDHINWHLETYRAKLTVSTLDVSAVLLRKKGCSGAINLCVRLHLDVGYIVDEKGARQDYGARHHCQHQQEGCGVWVQKRNIDSCEKGPT